MSRRKSSNSSNSYIPGGPSPFWAAQGLPPEGVRKTRKTTMTDLQVIKAMLRRAKVKFDLYPRRVADCLPTPGSEVEYKTLGISIEVGEGSHTAVLHFDTKRKLVDVEGGGY